MRGKIKTVSWLSLILVIMIAMMPNLVKSQVVTIYVDPSEVSGILPSDPDPYFTVDIMISDVVDLWSVGFTVDYRPFVKTIVAVEVTQGDFLEDPDPAGFQTWFIETVDTFRGEVKIGYARLPQSKQFPFPQLDPVGQDGSGLLATIKFKVISAGESPINLVDVGLHDSNGNEILGYEVGNSYFYGPTANLIWATLKKSQKVGNIQTFKATVRNEAGVPLEVRAHWDMYRVQDGQRLEIYSGQSYSGFGPVEYEYLYVNEYNEWLEWDWVNPGSSVIGEPDGIYTESTHYCAITSLYGFEDLVLGDRLIGNVILEGYTQYPDGFDWDNDLDTYAFTTTTGWVWLGSLYGDTDWDWQRPRWVGGASASDRFGALLDVNELNSLEVLVHYWTADGADHGRGRIDALRLRVEFSKFVPVSPESYVIQPYEVLILPDATWTLNAYDVGIWVATCTCEYRYTWTDEAGYHTTAWIPSENVYTRTWWVKFPGTPKPWI